MAVDFSGKWTLASSDNFEAYLDAIGAQQDRKEKLLSGNALQIIDQSGDTIKMTYQNINVTVDFTVGQEKEQPLPNGTRVKGTPKWEGSQLVSYDQTAEGKHHKMTWEIIGGEFVKTFEYEGVTAVRRFKRA